MNGDLLSLSGLNARPEFGIDFTRCDRFVSMRVYTRSETEQNGLNNAFFFRDPIYRVEFFDIVDNKISYAVRDCEIYIGVGFIV